LIGAGAIDGPRNLNGPILGRSGLSESSAFTSPLGRPSELRGTLLIELPFGSADIHLIVPPGGEGGFGPRVMNLLCAIGQPRDQNVIVVERMRDDRCAVLLGYGNLTILRGRELRLRSWSFDEGRFPGFGRSLPAEFRCHGFLEARGWGVRVNLDALPALVKENASGTLRFRVYGVRTEVEVAGEVTRGRVSGWRESGWRRFWSGFGGDGFRRLDGSREPAPNRAADASDSVHRGPSTHERGPGELSSSRRCILPVALTDSLRDTRHLFDSALGRLSREGSRDERSERP
jgi:hypothetical protein